MKTIKEVFSNRFSYLYIVPENFNFVDDKTLIFRDEIVVSIIKAEDNNYELEIFRKNYPPIYNVKSSNQYNIVKNSVILLYNFYNYRYYLPARIKKYLKIASSDKSIVPKRIKVVVSEEEMKKLYILYELPTKDYTFEVEVTSQTGFRGIIRKKGIIVKVIESRYFKNFISEVVNNPNKYLDDEDLLNSIGNKKEMLKFIKSLL